MATRSRVSRPAAIDSLLASVLAVTRSFAISWDYRCPFARNAHEHVLAAFGLFMMRRTGFRVFFLKRAPKKRCELIALILADDDEPPRRKLAVVGHAHRDFEDLLAVHPRKGRARPFREDVRSGGF